MAEKWLWSVDSSYNAVLTAADAAGARNLVIRTSADWLPAAMPQLKSKYNKVYAWRMPATDPAVGGDLYALKQADYVVANLIPAGLDGYVIDAEDEAATHPRMNWNEPGLESLAANFCQTLRAAAPPSFVIGLTAGCTEPGRSFHLPWAQLVDGCDVLYPQSYWRSDGSLDGKHDNRIKRKTPQEARDTALTFWTGVAKGKPIITMFGELDEVEAAEIAACQPIITGSGMSEAHFYAEVASDEILRAVKSLTV